MDSLKNIAVDRICWGAILAGVIITLAGESLLNLLGLGLGLTSFTVDMDVISNIGMGAVIWLILSGALCMFLGGWVAGRLVNSHFYVEGILHGLVAWGLATLLTFLLMATTAGALISGATSVIGQVFSLTGKSATSLSKGISQIAPQLSTEQKNMIPSVNPMLKKIKEEADQILADNNKKNESIQGTEQTGISEEAPQTSEKIKAELEQDLIALFSYTNETEKTNARQKLIDYLVKNKGMDQFQAEQKVNEWQQNYIKMKEEVKGKAIVATEQASNALGKSAIIIFLMFLLSAITGALGGMLGVVSTRKNNPSEFTH